MHDHLAPAPVDPGPRTPDEGPDLSWSTASASVTAGAGLLAMVALAGVGLAIAILGTVTPGDAARTAADVAASEGLFRVGIVAVWLIAILDVVVAWALYRVLAPAHRGLSLLAAWLRLVYAGVLVAAVGHLSGVLRLLDDGYLAVVGRELRDAQVLLGVEAFEDLWSAGLLLFGGHLVVLGIAAYRSGYVPRALGALLILAGAGYAYDSVAAVLSAGAAVQVATVTFVGEVLLAVWLLVRGRRLPNDPRLGVTAPR